MTKADQSMEVQGAQVKAHQAPDADKLVTYATDLTIGLNHINRSMGLADVYPFVLSAPQ